MNILFQDLLFKMNKFLLICGAFLVVAMVMSVEARPDKPLKLAPPPLEVVEKPRPPPTIFLERKPELFQPSLDDLQ